MSCIFTSCNFLSCIFMSCIFIPCCFVRHFHVHYFQRPREFMSPMQRCFSDLVCQPLVISYVIDPYLCLATLHAWTLEYQYMMPCVWWWIPTKAKGFQLKKTAGSPSQRLAQQDSKEDANASPEITRGHGAAQRSLGLRDDDDGGDDDDDEGSNLWQKWRVKLIFQDTYRLSISRIVECLKIINHWRMV